MKGRIFALLTLALAALVAVIAGSASGPADARPQQGTTTGQSTTIRIWTDRDRKAAVTQVTSAWARNRNVRVDVVEKNFGDIRDDLKTVTAETAPDVIVAAHDWTGKLAADGSVVPLRPRKAALSQIPSYALQAFSYGRTASQLYGAPVALENIGLVVNTRLAKVPKSWADLERQALAFKRKGGGRLAIAVQQGANGDAYHMYPFFSGLCGYVFGRTRGGALNPNDLGVANRRFLANTSTIDRWNRLGLINAKVDSSTAQNAFMSGKAAFWVTGPWNADSIRQKGIPFRVVQVPAIKCKSVPFLGVQGFMVTKFARTHGVESAAKDLVGSYMLGSAAQQALSVRNGRYPANVLAAKKVTNPALKQFGQAGKGGVPMPNIPQMDSVWGDLGGAWVKATKGAGATKARTAFSVAARNIRNKIG